MRENRFLADAAISSEADGTFEPPWGLFGGKAGVPLRGTLTHADGSEENLYSKMTNFPLKAGSMLRWEQASGGGYGEPFEREPEAVARDVKDQYLTIKMARNDYGVAIDPETMTVDHAKTAELRKGEGQP